MSPRMKTALAVVWCMVAGRLGYDRVFGVGSEGVAPRKPLSTFMDETGWNPRKVPLEQNIIEVAGDPSDYSNWSLSKDGIRLWFYAGYYNGTSVAAIHTPNVCMKGAGWSMAKSELFQPAGRSDLRFQLLHWQHSGVIRRLTAHTLHYREEYDPSVWRVYLGRAFGPRNWAILIYTVDFGGEKDLEKAKALLEDLILRTAPKLDVEYLPVVATGNPER